MTIVERPVGQLVTAAQEGDAESFIELYRRYYAAAVGIAYSRLSDRHLAEDAAHEAFAIARRDLKRLRCGDKVAHWLNAICRKVACRLVKLKPQNGLPKDLPESIERVTAWFHAAGTTYAFADFAQPIIEAKLLFPSFWPK